MREDVRPRILVLTSVYLPGYKGGGPVRSVEGIVEQLGDDLRFFVIVLDRDLGDTHPYPGIQTGSWVPVGKAAVRYLPRRAYGYRSLRRIVQEIQPDTIYLNTLFSIRFAVLPLLAARALTRRPGGVLARIVLAPSGQLNGAALRRRWYKKAIFLIGARITRLFSCVTWQATTTDEVKEIRRAFPAAKVLHAANLHARPPAKSTPPPKAPGSLRAVYIARVVAHKNLLWLLDVLRSTTGSIELDVIGPLEDDSYWRRCLAAIQHLPPAIVVRYRGEVPHDQVAAELASRHLMVLPTRHENFGHVILESLAVGRPVLISDQTPWRGLAEAGAGWDLSLACADDFREALAAAVAMGDAELQAMSVAAASLAMSQMAMSERREAARRMLTGDAGRSAEGPR